MSQFCMNCGKEILSDLKICSSCEHPVNQLSHQTNHEESNKKEKRNAVLSIVFGVLGIYPILGIGGIIGMIIASKGIKLKHTAYRKHYKIGFWISLGGTLFWVIALVVTLVIAIMPILEFIWEMFIYYLRLLFGEY